MGKKRYADPEKIYTVRMAGDAEANMVAMDVDDSGETIDGICFLTPPDHGHAISGRMGKQTENGFTFLSKGYAKGEWEFAELTYDVLKAGFYKHLYGGEHLLELVHSTEEIREYYHKNFPSYV